MWKKADTHMSEVKYKATTDLAVQLYTETDLDLDFIWMKLQTNPELMSPLCIYLVYMWAG